MIVVTAADAAFLPGVAALAKSLAANGRAGPLHVMLLGRMDSGNPDYRYIRSHCSLHFPEVANLGGGLPTTRWLSTAMYARLLIPELFSSQRRVLYLDADTLVLGPLDELDRMAMGNYPTAATLEQGLKTVSSQIKGNPDLPATPAFYSGFLLMRPGLWREQRLVQRTIDALHQYGSRIKHPDQGALNVAHGGNWMELAPWWHHSYKKRAPDEQTRVLHFNGPHKPWGKMPAGDARTLWESYYAHG